MSNGTPIPSGQQPLVVAGFTIHVLREDRNHILIGIRVHVVHRIAFIERVSDQLRLRKIGNGRGYHVRHVSIVAVLGHIEFLVRIELPDGRQVNITAAEKLVHVIQEPGTIMC